MESADSARAPRRNPGRLRRLAPPVVVAAGIAIACAVAAPRPGDPAPPAPPPAASPDAAPRELTPEEKAAQDEYVRRFRLAQQLFGSGRDAEASKLLHELAAEQPDAAAVHHALAYIELHQGRTASALEGFLKAARLAPEDGAIRRDCGMRLVEAGRHAEALPHLDAAKRLLDPDLETLCAEGRALEALGRTADAEQAYRAAHRLDPDSVDARALLARRVLGTKPDEALALLEKVPVNWADVVEVKAAAYERLNRWTDAAGLWRRLAELAPRDAAGVAPLRTAAESLVRCGDAPGAVAVAERWAALDRDGERPGVRVSVCLAVARAGTGDAKAALAALDACSVPDGAPAAIRAHLGLLRAHLLVLLGRPADARADLARVAELDAPFERAAARYLLGKEPYTTVRDVAAKDAARGNDAAWVAWLGAVLADDTTAAAEHLAKARATSRPPGEHPAALLAGVR